MRHTDTSPGWINRRFKKIEAELRESRVAKRLQAATIGRGGLTVKDGGGITVEGGIILATYPDGSPAAIYGPLRTLGGETLYGVASVTPSGRIIFAYYGDGATPEDAGKFQVGAVSDGTQPDFTIFGADCAIYGDKVTLSGGSYTTTDLNQLILHGSSHAGLSYSAWDASPANAFKIPTHPTSAAAANTVIDPTTGVISRATSSRRYKRDIADAAVDTTAVLELQPRRFRLKAEVDELGDDAPWHVGFIAEEAADLGLDDWVTEDADGPEAFSYSTYVVALQAVVRDLAARVAALEEQQP